MTFVGPWHFGFCGTLISVKNYQKMYFYYTDRKKCYYDIWKHFLWYKISFFHIFKKLKHTNGSPKVGEDQAAVFSGPDG